MTNRCRILIVVGILGLWVAVLRNQTVLASLSLTVLVWIFWQWVNFEFRLWYYWPKYLVTRQINGRPSAEVTTLWAGRTYAVSVEITATAGAVAPISIARELLPDNMIINSGSALHTCCDGGHAVGYDFVCQCPSAGALNWFGVHFEFQNIYGLFRAERVYRCAQKLKVLPNFEQATEMRPTVKRVNAIPQHGIHPLRRAGLGSELWDLREYQPGDPPKSIAWKLTARRGKLMTRQYESEVPVRITVLINADGNVRSGGLEGRPFDHLASIAASIAQAAVSAGDAVGIVLLDEINQLRLRPAHGEQALYRVLDALAKFSPLTHVIPQSLSAETIKVASACVRERFPDLLEPTLYRAPLSLFPIWPSRRKDMLHRRQLATVLAESLELSPTTMLELTHDDQTLARYLVPWLASIGCGLPANPTDAKESSSEERLNRLAKELVQSVTYANDNELFVIMADLTGTNQQLENLFSATKVALSRHHRVTFICASPLPSTPNFQSPHNVDEVYAQVDRLDASARSKSLQRRFRTIGAKFTFAHKSGVVAAIMAEAELAGRGRYVARDTLP